MFGFRSIKLLRRHGLRAWMVGLSIVWLSGASPLPRGVRVTAPPARMIWAWERPVDLRYLANTSRRESVGVAFYGSTVVVHAGRCIVRPRRAPLLLDPSTYRMAVLRLEAGRGERVVATQAVLDGVVAEARRLLALPRVRSLQLDFDARASERAAHAAVVRALRDGLPRATFLSVTTLASHCFGDPLAGASVTVPDEIVPMYFRMASDDRRIRERLRVLGGPHLDRCRQSVGIADDEPRPAAFGREREYLFLTGATDDRSVRARVASFLMLGERR